MRNAQTARIVSLVSLVLVVALFPNLGNASVLAAPGAALASPSECASQAAAWLVTQQQADGSVGSAGQTCEVVLALTSAGWDTANVINNSNSLLDSLALQASTYSSSGWDPANQAAELLQAIVAAGQNPYDFGGVDLVKRLNGYYDAGSGAFGKGNWSLASYILALAALRQPIPAAAVNKLKAGQLASGAWEYTLSWGGDLDTTGKALQALAASGQPITTTPFISATALFRSTQKAHGGWQTSWDSDINPNTTALVTQGLLAAGMNPAIEPLSSGGHTPLEALLATRNPTSGAFQYGGADNILASAQVIPALLGQIAPRHGRGVAFHQAIAYLAEQQLADGSFPGGFGSNAGATLDAVLGGVAADFDPRDWDQGGSTTPLDYLGTTAEAYTTPYTSTWESSVFTTTAVAQTGKLIAGVVAAEAYTDSAGVAYFAGIPLQARLDANLAWSPADNSLSDYAWAAIGYAALGQPVPAAITEALLALQEPAGGWSWWGDYAYGTSLVVQALLAAGVQPTSTQTISATAFIHTLQDAGTGAFATAPGGAANMVATGNLLQTIAALGRQPTDFAVHTSGGITLTANTPDQWLLKTQSPEGSFDNTASATGQALQGLSSRALPIHFRPVAISTGLEKRQDVERNSAFHAILNTALDPASVATTTFTLVGPGGPVASTVSYSGRTATLTPKASLQGGATYRLTVHGFQGMRRKATGPAYHWDVTTMPYRTFLPLVSR